ncbi:MAG: ECF-type sigma factor [Planctomycetota bacterium]
MDLTRIIQSAERGDAEARAEVIRAAYEDLRKLAAARMWDERQDHTLSATALVHEVSIKLLHDTQLPVEGKAQFFAYASSAMRHFLIDHARTKGRQKRGGDRKKLLFEDALTASEEQSEDLVELHHALERFAEVDPRKAQVVEIRYFGGLSLEDTAKALDVSVATVKRDWDVARLWLRRELANL